MPVCRFPRLFSARRSEIVSPLSAVEQPSGAMESNGASRGSKRRLNTEEPAERRLSPPTHFSGKAGLRAQSQPLNPSAMRLLCSSLASFVSAVLAFTATASAQNSQSLSTDVQERETRFFEIRIETAAPGKLDALQARYRDHTRLLLPKHGVTCLGFWVPIDNPDNQFITLMMYQSRAEREPF